MSEPIQPEVLSIGAILGDYNVTSKAWLASIQEIMNEIIELRDGVESPLCVNVVYHVDGKGAPNEFEGVRTGRFSRKTAHLMVQAAVPLLGIDDRRGLLLGLLRDAIDEAERFARKRRIAEDLTALRELVGRLPQGRSGGRDEG